jgi:hypothetical protein
MSRNLLLKRCLAFTDFTSFKDISLCAVRESVNTKIKKCTKPITKPVQSKNWSPVFKYLKTENIPKIVHMIEDVRVSRFCFLASSTIIILSLSNEISPFISLNVCIVSGFIMVGNVRRYVALAQSRGGACFCTRGAVQDYAVITLFSRWQKP